MIQHTQFNQCDIANQQKKILKTNAKEVQHLFRIKTKNDNRRNISI